MIDHIGENIPKSFERALVKLLSKRAKKLDLQILLADESPVIEQALKKRILKNRNSQDGIVNLTLPSKAGGQLVREESKNKNPVAKAQVKSDEGKAGAIPNGGPKADSADKPGTVYTEDYESWVPEVLVALASFKGRKKKNWAECYRDGILLTDQIGENIPKSFDRALVRLLFKRAKKLDLQILLTHGSPVIAQALEKRISKKQNSSDGIANLTLPSKAGDQMMAEESKNKNPAAKDQIKSVEEKADAKPNGKSKEQKEVKLVTVYTEDSEALFVLDVILNVFGSKFKKNNQNVRINKVALGLGGVNLLHLAQIKELPFRKDSINFLDGDQKNEKKQTPQNVLYLPTKGNKQRSPENELKNLLEQAKKKPQGEVMAALRRQGFTAAWVVENLNKLEMKEGQSKNKKERLKNKKWFNSLNEEERFKLLKAWIETAKEEIELFLVSLEKAIRTI